MTQQPGPSDLLVFQQRRDEEHKRRRYFVSIDRSFVMGCTEQKNNLIIIRAIIAMGHSLGMKIVAEGIETEEQLKLMTEYGVDEAQGYYFKPPVSPEDFVKLLEKGTL